MARIIETEGKRRIIKMTADDIISIVREYQQAVPRGAEFSQIRSYLEDIVVYVPEDI